METLTKIMIKVFSLIAALFLTSCGDSVSKIHGTWERDNEAAIKFLLENNELTEKQKTVHTALLSSQMTSTYHEDGTGQITIGAYQLPDPEGNLIEIEEMKADFTFEILGENKSQIVIKIITDDEFIDNTPFYILSFNGRDEHHFISGHDHIDLNVRENYTRVKTD